MRPSSTTAEAAGLEPAGTAGSPATVLPGALPRRAIVLIAVIASGAALKWLSGIIAPLLLAIFLAIMVDGLGRALRRRLVFLPATAAGLLALVLLALAFGLVSWALADNAGGFVDRLASYAPRLDYVIARAAVALRLKPTSLDQLLAGLDPGPVLAWAAGAFQGIASSAALVLVYLGFLVVSRRAFERKAVRLFATREGRSEALRVFIAIRDGLWRYLWIQTALGLVIAIASFAVMLAVGLDDALFWAFLIFVVNYIPILGAVVAIAAPALIAVVQFESLAQGAIVAGALFAITFVVGNVALPRMQGSSFNMDPLVVLLSLAFWGALLGVTGMFLSTPLTVLAMVVLAQFEGSRWIAVLLSADGEPTGVAATG